MKIIKAFPPNYAAIAQRFPVKGKQGILYAWGNRIYNPSGIDVLPWILAHESVHGQRQCMIFDYGVEIDTAVKAWWKRYLAEPVFRLDEEIAAHRAEWTVYSANRSGKVERQWYLDMMVARLSGPLYDNMITPSAARKEITQ